MTILNQDNIKIAIDTLESAISDYKSFPPGTLDGMIVSSEIAIICMKLQVGKKPKLYDRFIAELCGHYVCQTCEAIIPTKEVRYPEHCCRCSQGIDWENKLWGDVK